MTPSERFVAELCEKSFLPFWCFPSPLGKKDKELCDVLVVCGNDIIIISVKDIKISDHNDPDVQYQRWQKAAINDSIKQIYGAERFIDSVSEIAVKDKAFKIDLPKKSERQIYRIAIAFGGENLYPMETGDFGKGFVHVFDEESTFTVLNELDTITDFIYYLKTKESFLLMRTIFVPREVDFLALFIQTELVLDHAPDSLVIDHGLWEFYVKSPEYQKWLRDIKDSFIWDEIVSQLHRNHILNNGTSNLRSNLERATRIITMEPRMNRIELAMILNDAINKRLKGRMIKPLTGSDHCYVLMPLNEKNWKRKEEELQLRCMVARSENPNVTKVIGLGIGKDSKGIPIFDLVFLDIPELNIDVLEKVRNAKDQLGYFKNPVVSHSRDMR